MSELETERKFLVRELPQEIADLLPGATSIEIDQGYTPLGWRVRRVIRHDGITEYSVVDKVKTPDPRTRLEVHPAGTVSESQFEGWWDQTEGRRIRKTRYIIPLDGLEMHLDLFKGGHLDAKMLVEVEFPSDSPELFERFNPPEWFGREVTGEFSNHSLARGKQIPNE